MKRIDFENGNIVSNILKAALPMLVAQIMSLLYNIVDRVYIARIPDVGTTALGAVGLCFPIIVIITAFSNLFGTGGAPIFSIERGKGNHAKAGLLMNTSFTLLALCAVILMIAGLLFARPILVLFGASDAGLAYAYPYLMIYLLGTFPSMAATGMNPFINAQGYATTGMISVIIGAITNLLLDPLFIFVLGLGIKGAAIATVISQTLSAAFVLYFLHYKAEYRIRFLSKTELASCGEDAKNIVSLGTAGFIMQLTNSLVTICANNVLSVTGGDVSHIRYDHHLQCPSDGRNADLRHHRRFLADHQLQLRCQTPPKNTSGRYHHGCFSADLYAAHLERDSGCTSLPDRYFQLGSGPDDRYRPRHETLFCCIYLHAAAICGPNNFQSPQQEEICHLFLHTA